MSNIAKFKVDLLKANNLVPGALFPGFSWKANEYVVPQSRETDFKVLSLVVSKYFPSLVYVKNKKKTFKSLL